MKTSVLLIALFLIVACNLSMTQNIALAQDKKENNTRPDTLNTTVKKTQIRKEWKVTKSENKNKIIGKTKDGKIIYEGPRGGRYYISDKGRKVYIKKN